LVVRTGVINCEDLSTLIQRRIHAIGSISVSVLYELYKLIENV